MNFFYKRIKESFHEKTLGLHLSIFYLIITPYCVIINIKYHKEIEQVIILESHSFEIPRARTTNVKINSQRERERERDLSRGFFSSWCFHARENKSTQRKKEARKRRFD